MDGSLVTKLVENIQPLIVDHEGRKFAVSGTGVKMIQPPVPEPLVVHSLTGLAGYLKKCASSSPRPETEPRPDETVVLVDDFDVVKVIGLDRDRRHFASALGKGIEDDRAFLPPDEVILRVRTEFHDTEEAVELIDTLSSVKLSREVNLTDDGFISRVTVDESVTLKRSEKPRRQFSLESRAGFAEAPLPERIYLLRARQVKDEETVRVALLPVVQPEWDLKARSSIAKWLEEHAEGWTVLS